jgi:hypothetical protein
MKAVRMTDELKPPIIAGVQATLRPPIMDGTGQTATTK